MEKYEDGEFRMVIHLGNDAMTCNSDIADALHIVRGQLLRGQTGGVVLDVNGNGAGTWAIESGVEDG